MNLSHIFVYVSITGIVLAIVAAILQKIRYAVTGDQGDWQTRMMPFIVLANIVAMLFLFGPDMGFGSRGRAEQTAWTTWTKSHCRIAGNAVARGTDDNVGVGVTTGGKTGVLFMPGTPDKDYIVYQCNDNTAYQAAPDHVPAAFLAAHTGLVDAAEKADEAARNTTASKDH